jgi:inward rectifier potassium channel
MSDRKRRRSPKPVPIGPRALGLRNLGAQRFDLRDPYHLAVSLSWPAFIVAMVGVWLAINLTFAALYVLSPGDIANARPGSFGDTFFFSIETLATVGYGVMAPATTFGHILSAIEIVIGTAFTAIVTGLLFVRFSRPQTKILYAENAVITIHNGNPTLMLRAANGRASVMTGAKARLFVLLEEHTTEGIRYRRIHDLRLLQPNLPIFVMPWTLMHMIDRTSPLHGYTPDELAASATRMILTIEARDQALAALVQDIKDYRGAHVRFGMHFAEAVTVDESGNATADLSRLSLLEPDAANP